MESDVLAAYTAAVRAAPFDLMSPRALDELETRHVPEALALAEMLPPGPARLVDVGSGAGFPGFVVAIARPDLEVTLVEATRKKAAFLRETAAALGVALDVVAGRAEEERALRGAFDLATARGVAPLERLVPLVLPLLRPGGLLYAVKGDRWAEELDAAHRKIGGLHARIVATPDGAPPDAPVRVVVIAAAGASRPAQE